MTARYIYRIAICFIILLLSCNSTRNPFAGKKSPHEKYGDRLNNSGLKKTHLGALWFDAASTALKKPVEIALPYKETGYFPADRPSASGYVFSVKRGQNILLDITLIPSSGVLFFAEIWQQEGEKFSLATAMDTLNQQLKYTIKREGRYIVRLQSELLQSVEYTVTIAAGPSLAFPVDRSGKPAIISPWGVGRDNGTRRHKGVDIAAKFRTPVLAAANGITRLNENKLGGKTIFLVDDNTGYSLYYAHLDSQVATSGMRVRVGDTIGLVGKTGNAQHTAPHLHFGIYTGGGAIDPLLFIGNRSKEAGPVTASTKQLNQWLRTISNASVYSSASLQSGEPVKLNAGEPLRLLAATADWYKIQLAGDTGKAFYIKSNLITVKKLRQHTVLADARLLEMPRDNVPAKTLISKGTTVDIIGAYHNYYLVSFNALTGWISQ